MNDEDIYLRAEKEFDSDKRIIALWLKSLTLNNGDEKSAKYTYINLRVEQIKETINKAPIFKAIDKELTPLDEGYNPKEAKVLKKILYTLIFMPIALASVYFLLGDTDLSVNFAVGAVVAGIAIIWSWKFPYKQIKNIDNEADKVSEKLTEDDKPYQKIVAYDKKYMEMVKNDNKPFEINDMIIYVFLFLTIFSLLVFLVFYYFEF